MIDLTTEQHEALLRLIDRTLRSTEAGRRDLTKRNGEHANTAALDAATAMLESIRTALNDDEAVVVYVCEGHWHPNVKSGQVHEHNNRTPIAHHRLCDPVFTRRRAAPPASFGNTYGVDVEVDDMLRVMPGVPAERVEHVEVGPRSTTITLEGGRKVYCASAQRVHIEGRP